MNKATVGMENLPNVFIDKIISEPRVVSFDSETIQYNVKVVVKMYDHVNYSWYNKVPGLKVKCAFVTDNRIDQLNNGDISLYDVPLGETHKATAQACDSFRFSRNDNGYKSFVSTFEYNTLTAPQNLNVYVACFIDDLNFGIPQFDKFYGPMAAEVIFVGGQLNQSSNYFYDPETNEEYGGPVHFHSQGYMEGSEHTSEPHRQLRLIEEENYKIVAPSEYDLDTVVAVQPREVNLEGPETPGGPRTNIPDVEVQIEDPNVPTSPLTEIAE